MPPPRPDFCYYEALGLEKTASCEEIVSAYRKLARIHHPDKNLNDENATARFQQIQAAHETLSDPSKRTSYDRQMANRGRQPSSTSPFANSAYANTAADDFFDDLFDDDEDEDEDDYGGFFFFTSGGRGAFFSGFNGGRHYGPSREEMERLAAERAAEREEQRKQDEIRAAATRAEVRAKLEAEERARQKKEVEKKLAELREKQAFEKRESDERIAQDKLWRDLRATTVAEKQETCLHSAFWSKIKSTKKCKCDACGQKRGLIAFKCPHCALVACQLCLKKFNEKRQRSSK